MLSWRLLEEMYSRSVSEGVLPTLRTWGSSKKQTFIKRSMTSPIAVTVRGSVGWGEVDWDLVGWVG